MCKEAAKERTRRGLPKDDRFPRARDEVFCSAKTATEGVRFENTSPTEPLVTLRYYDPETNPDAPAIGDANK
ncbi:MAG: hypothetical protein CMI30_09580 [Opitutae bacterium]|nr:hypothetical protein [Opitutae bacterium]